jgi:hypothetical protein
MSRRRLPFSLSFTPAAALTLVGGVVATAALTAAVGRLEFDKEALAFAQDSVVRVAALQQGLAHPAASGVAAQARDTLARAGLADRDRVLLRLYAGDDTAPANLVYSDARRPQSPCRRCTG